MIVYLQMIEGEENKRQFAALYETYRGLMFYTANSILHNSQDAAVLVITATLALGAVMAASPTPNSAVRSIRRAGGGACFQPYQAA